MGCSIRALSGEPQGRRLEQTPQSLRRSSDEIVPFFWLAYSSTSENKIEARVKLISARPGKSQEI